MIAAISKSIFIAISFLFLHVLGRRRRFATSLIVPQKNRLGRSVRRGRDETEILGLVAQVVKFAGRPETGLQVDRKAIFRRLAFEKVEQAHCVCLILSVVVDAATLLI